jgi:hypothetical protein
MHWLVTSQGETHEVKSRKEAVNCLKLKYSLSSEQINKLEKNLIIKYPRRGYLEIETCDCTNGKHSPDAQYGRGAVS